MKKNILIIIGGLIILWIGLSYGYFLGQKQVKVEPTMDSFICFPSSPLIKDWQASVSGKVAEITDRAIVISSDDEIIAISISEETIVKKFIIREGKIAETVEGFTLQDIQKDDVVSIEVIAGLEKDLRAKAIYIQEIP